MSDSGRLTAGTIWQETLAALRPDFGLLFAVAAPFTLLVSVALELFGPAPPKTLADLTPKLLLTIGLLPTVIGAIGQLALVRLVLRPGETPGTALRLALAALPAWVAATLLTALPVGLGLILLVVPGLYLVVRLYLVPPVLMMEGVGPIRAITRSWELTANIVWPVMLFLVLALLGVLGASLLAAGLGGAIGSVLLLAGSKGAADFAAALVPALFSTLVAMAGSAAAAVLYRRVC